TNDDNEAGTNARLVLDPATLTNRGGDEAQRWWDLLRVRVSAPQGAVGEVRVAAATTSRDD
ncbi:MAG TPA: hypothetical protein VEB68_09375, partial [Croceibacterium sp.]|nr:hypothetical protein [Croceibacterium sp.]